MQSKRIAMIIAPVAFFALAVPLSVMAADSPDKYPNGCVSCHTGDRVITKELAKVKGHVDVTKIVKSVPDGCVMCHKAGTKANALSIVIHTVHSVKDPGAKPATSAFTGACLNCHAVDAKANTVAIKKGAPNW